MPFYKIFPGPLKWKGLLTTGQVDVYDIESRAELPEPVIILQEKGTKTRHELNLIGFRNPDNETVKIVQKILILD
jgi:hypothetical protein